VNKDIAAISLDMFENAKKYWLEKLSGELTGPEFSSDLPSRQTDSIDSFKMALAKNLSEKIIHLSNNNDLLLYVLLMTGLKIMLYKYTGRNDIIVSALTLKKSTQSYNRWIMLRDFLHPRMTFKELLMKVKDTVFAGFKNQYYPVHKLMKLLDIPDNNSLSRVTLLLESLHGKELAGLETEGFATDLVFSFEQQDEELEVEVIFNSNFFQAGTIRGMWSCYRHVMTQVFNHTGIKIADVRLIPEEEKKKILFRFNQPQPDSRVDKTIHQLFADQVKKTPGSPAVHFGASRYWTYRELNNRANRLAKVLKQRGVSANCPVGLMIERSAHALLGMLGILKAGGAYIPIDPAYPADRLNFMLKDSSTRVLLTRENIHAENEKLETYKHLHGLDILLVDESNDECEEDLPGDRKDTQPVNLFYVIYTSGSTGRPKGVLIPHGNFVNLIHFHKELFHESHGTRMSQVTSLGFDAAAFEIWPCLLNGRCPVYSG
jgi:non-ribosomal peptide synthetase component F